MTAGTTIRVDRFGQVQTVSSFVYVPSGLIEPDDDGVYLVTVMPA
jgi:hypothetical protein